MGTQAADSIGQSSAGIGANTSTSADVAADMVSQHRTAGTLDTTALAADVQARAGGDPQAQADLTAQVEAQLTSAVERGQFTAALEGANDNATPQIYNATVEGRTFSVGHPDAPAVSTWGSQPAGQGYKETWDATAARLGTTDPAAITADIEAQLAPPIQLDPITVTAEAPSAEPAQTGSEEGIGSFFEGLIKGDFSDNNSWSATAGQVIGGFIPIVGQIGDARDTVAAVGDVIEGKDGAWGNLGLAAVAWVPGVGDIARGALRGGEKVLDAGGEIAQQATRHADDVTRHGDDVARHADEVAGTVRTGRVGQNEVRWTADAEGRPVHAEATLRELHDGTPRSSAEQRAQRETGHAGNPGDQGGHIIGHRFMPDQGTVNMFPQAGQFNNSAYRTMENEWADWISAGGEVRVKVDLKDYQGARPDRINVSYDVYDQGGNLIYQGGERFKNEAGQVFDRVPRADIQAALNH